MDNNKDNEDWSDLLAGKTVAGADKDTIDEVNLIKKTLAYIDEEQHNPAELERLLFRLKREKLLVNKKPRWQNPVFLSAIAASVIGVIVTTQYLPKTPLDNDNPFTIKGFIMPQIIKHKNPRQQAQLLLKQLQPLNVAASVTDQPNKSIVDIQLIEKTEEITKVLKSFGVIMPKGQQLRVEIVTE